MLYNQKIKIKWNNASKKYYIKLGYQFTKINDEFYVDVKDLQLASSTINIINYKTQIMI